MLEDVPQDIIFTETLKVSCACVAVWVCVCVRARATSVFVRENLYLRFLNFVLCVYVQQGRHIAAVTQLREWMGVVVMMSFICSCRNKIGAELHIYLEEVHSTPFFLPPEDTYPVLLRPNSTPR